MCRRKRIFGIVVVMLLVVFLLTGCSNVNKENYDKLKMGMTYTEVTDILGAPDNCSETMGAKNCLWGDDEVNIKVKFVVDKVVWMSNTGLK
ncbi:MAG: DUF3862 domain-containing protein [Deltaproteobacteria bacterium]|nr:DUF3862 domain-containing protein [Deltaproteobacteria bacterium]